MSDPEDGGRVIPLRARVRGWTEPPSAEEWAETVLGVTELESGWLAEDVLAALEASPGPDGPGRAVRIAAALRMAGWRL